MIKNKKGFTLVELLGAIVILGIISTIAIVSLTKVLESSHKKYYDTQVKLLQTAGQTYFSDHKDLLPIINFGVNRVNLGVLIDQGYINEIVDYNKKECYTDDRSYVTVTRRGPSSYVYQAVLSCKDRSTQTQDNNNEKGNFNINLDYSNGIDSSNGFKEENIYYVRGTLSLGLTITTNSSGDNAGIIGYRYSIVKKSNGKIYKTSEVIPSKDSICTSSGDNCTTLSDTINIRAKDIKDGEYTLEIEAFNLKGNSNNKQFATYTIVIDKTKPKCNITLPTKTNDNFVNGWYNGKASNGSITFTDAYLSNYDITNNSNPTYNNFISGTSETRLVTLKDTTTSGQTFYGYVKDIAGNIGTCKTDVIKVDKSSPTCSVNTTTSPNGKNGWFTSIPTIKLSDTTKDNGYSGINSYGLSTTENTYNNSHTNTQGNTTGKKWYGVIKDNAGNVNPCNSDSIKVDTSKPVCDYIGNDNWTKNDVTISWGCKEDKAARPSGCAKNANEFGNKVFNASNENIDIFTIGAYTISSGSGLTTNCGNTGISVKHDTIPPTCPVVTPSVASDTWTKSNIKFNFDFKGTDTNKYKWFTNTNSYAYTDWGENLVTVTSKEISGEGVRQIHIDTYDHVENKKECSYNANYYIDKTPPEVYKTTDDGFRNGFRINSDNKNVMPRYIYCKDQISEGVSSGIENLSDFNTDLDRNNQFKEDEGTDDHSFTRVWRDNKTSVRIKYSYNASGFKRTMFSCVDRAGNSFIGFKDEVPKGFSDSKHQAICCVCRSSVSKTGTKNNSTIVKSANTIVYKAQDEKYDCDKAHSPTIDGYTYRYSAGELYLSCQQCTTSVS